MGREMAVSHAMLVNSNSNQKSSTHNYVHQRDGIEGEQADDPVWIVHVAANVVEYLFCFRSVNPPSCKTFRHAGAYRQEQ